MLAATSKLTAAEERAEQQEDEAARRGLIAQLPEGVVYDETGKPVWDWRPYSFLSADSAPSTVNPRLWRQAKRNAVHGLFEVVPGAIWQVRGYDIAVMTIIRGKTGWIIIDPLTTEEAAQASMRLVRERLGDRPVRAVIFSHSHGDHFGGVGGVVSQEQVAREKIRIIAPHGFEKEAISESILAGQAMNRRADYMFGGLLSPGAAGQVDTGLGSRIEAGKSGFMSPTESIGAEGANLEIDGVAFEFMDAAGTEAPAELLFYLPQWRALHTTEVATKTLHNLLTLRGAQVRDALYWSQVIDKALLRWGNQSDVQLASHGWPTFGAQPVITYLQAQRDAYRYIHDRALGAANRGATIQELPDLVEPGQGELHPSVRGYYGTINHGSKAVYQRYFGWWDGVPANYDPLPPEEAGKQYVRLAGGADAVIAEGKRAIAAGDYRWAAELLNHLVFADPGNKVAKGSLADAYEQLGFQAESGAWRNYYLSAAATLRDTERKGAWSARRQTASTLAALPTLDLLNLMATRYSPPATTNNAFYVAFKLSDSAEEASVEVRPTVEIPRLGPPLQKPLAVVTMKRADFIALATGRMDAATAVREGRLVIEGNMTMFLTWMGQHPVGSPQFPVVVP
jgi:alkyl sulfatase BDS1-like metallo-beta-lactamase superfamily hydrolase